MDNLRALYQEVILEHATKPRNFGGLDDILFTTNASCANGFNPLCGDKLRLCILFQGNQIKGLRFDGDGCAISKASASLLTEHLKDKTTQQALQLFDQFHAMIVDKQPPNAQLGKLSILQGVQQFPNRIKCATLAWHAFKAALQGQAEATTE